MIRVHEKVYDELKKLQGFAKRHGIGWALNDLFEESTEDSQYPNTRMMIIEDDEFCRSIVDILCGDIEVERYQMFYLKYENSYVNQDPQTGQLSLFLNDKTGNGGYITRFTEEEIKNNVFLDNPKINRIKVECENEEENNERTV